MGTASDGRYPSWVVNWSRIIGNIGRTLIASGVLILLFVVYQLWGTALQERRAQDALRSQFAVVLAEAPGAASLAEFGNDELPARLDPEAVLTAAVEDQDETGSTDTAETPRRSGTVLVDPSALIIDPDATTFGPPPPPPDGGEAIAHLRIPAIGLDKVVVEGVGTNALKKGPGHYPGTP
jgi:sortase A